MGERDSWFAIDGSPIAAPDFAMPEGQINAEPAPQNQILVRIDKPRDVVARVRVADASVVANMAHQDQDGLTLLVSFGTQGHAKSAALTVGIAEAEWKTLATNEKPDQAGNFSDKDYGELSFLPISDEDGLASVVVEHRHIEEPCEVFAVDAVGEKHRPNKVKAQSDGESEQMTYGYDIPAKNVSKLLVQVRPFSKFVDVKDISLEKGQITKPTIEVRDAEKK
jgi:hypothetical protein